jgi:hypothetical protein
VKKARGRNHRFSRIIRHSLRDGFTAYTYSPRGPGFLAPVVRSVRHASELDLSVGRPGPYDFAVRSSAVRPHDKIVRVAVAAIASRLTFRDDAHTPLKAEAGRAHHTPDSTFRKTELFLLRRLDRILAMRPDGQIGS